MTNAQFGSCSPTAGRESEFTELFSPVYQPLLRDVILAGATVPEAEDALQDTLTEVLRRWDEIENPVAWTRKAAITNMIKAKQRGPGRLRQRQIERRDYRPDGDEDPRLLIWEQAEWIAQVLSSLPPAQREVLAFVIDEFEPVEIAHLLGKTEAAVRQNLCAARKTLKQRIADAAEHASLPSARALTATSMERR